MPAYLCSGAKVHAANRANHVVTKRSGERRAHASKEGDSYAYMNSGESHDVLQKY